jgi:hypothetical protein
MKRRTFVRQAWFGVLGVTGCIQSNTGNGNAETFRGRSISIAEVDEIDEYQEVEITPNVTQSRISDDQPAKLTIQTVNTGEKRFFDNMSDGRHFSADWGGAFSESVPGLILLSSEREYTPEDGKWQYDPPDVDGPQTGIVIESGEAVINEYDVLDSPSGGYFPTGVHRFETRIRIQLYTSEGPVPGSTGRFTWGFAIEVTLPGN